METESEVVFFTYIIYSLKTFRYYVGSTSNLDKRLEEHNSGKTYSTRNRGPWKLVFSKMYPNRHGAIIMEKTIKSYKGGNAFKKLVGTN